jgi:hypothetical protein
MAKLKKKIPASSFLFAMLSAYRTLALLLDKRGVLQLDELILALQQTAAAHRESGDVVAPERPDTVTSFRELR